VFFILMSRFIITQLDRSYEIRSRDPRLQHYREEITRKFPGVTLEGDTLHYPDEAP
jgi:hypothetical protein